MTLPTMEQIRDVLALQPHPEGGWFREVHRSPATVPHPLDAAPRAAMTSIYFLLAAGDFSAWHRVRSEELWHHAAGGPMELHLIEERGDGEAVARCVRLGTDVLGGETPQCVVPAGAWQAARPAEGVAWSLASCVVAPGFDFADFEMPPRSQLLEALPQHRALIERFTRS